MSDTTLLRQYAETMARRYTPPGTYSSINGDTAARVANALDEAAGEIDTLRRVVRQLLVKPLVDDEHMARTLAQVHSLDHEQAAAVERADRKRRAWTDVS